MTTGLLFALVGIVIGALGVMLWAAMRAAGMASAAEENEDAARRQMEALNADAKRAEDIANKARMADAAPVDGGSLADRLRQSGRGRAPRK